jgi:hypothetical protein
MCRGINSRLIKICPDRVQNMTPESEYPGSSDNKTKKFHHRSEVDRSTALYAAKAHCAGVSHAERRWLPIIPRSEA